MAEKTNDERITEYIWLHADKSPNEIANGILKVFGVKKSLNWVTEEREEYLNADKPCTMEENTPISPLVDEGALQQIAKAFPSVNPKQIVEIIRLKASTRLGYRKIGQKLSPPVGKDTVMGILKMYQAISKPQQLCLKSPEVTKEEERHERSRSQVVEQEYIKRLRKETTELDRRYVKLRLENEGDDLIVAMVEHEIEKLHAETHRLFKQYCERHHLSTAKALQKIGVTAEALIGSFDDWYSQQAKDGDIGEKALAWVITLEVDAFLHKGSVR